jgi:hypothetical protein
MKLFAKNVVALQRIKERKNKNNAATLVYIIQIGLENPKEVYDSCEIMQPCTTSFCCFWGLTVKDGWGTITSTAGL